MKRLLLIWMSSLPAFAYSAPDIQVAGTVVPQSGKPTAIVAGPTMTFVVTEGEQLGDYRVVKIEPGSVTFRFKDLFFRASQSGPTRYWRRAK